MDERSKGEYVRKAALIFNPKAGNGRRQAVVEQAARVLRDAKVDVLLVPTTHAGSATEQARTALGAGCDAIIACGGDGTVLEILQTMVTSRTDAALGVIPFGTGNVLAKDLRLPLDPVRAARALLSCEARRIAVGLIRYTARDGATESRYFTVAAGVGAHARLIYSANAQLKTRRGMIAYYTNGFRLLFFHPFAPFDIELTDTDGNIRRTRADEIVAMRVRSFGGILRLWRPGGALAHDHLQLMMIKRARRSELLPYAVATMLGHSWKPRSVEIVSATRIVCTPVPDAETRIDVQADGESLGRMPLEISIVPNAFTLLMPRA